MKNYLIWVAIVLGSIFLISCSSDETISTPAPIETANIIADRDLNQCVTDCIEEFRNQQAVTKGSATPPPPGLSLCDCITSCEESQNK